MKKKRGKILFYFNFLRDGIQWNMLKLLEIIEKNLFSMYRKDFH